MDKVKLYMRLRAASGIIAAAMLVGIVFVYVYAGLWISILYTVVLLAFVGLCFLFRRLQRKEETRRNPPPPKGDFITGRIPSLPPEFGDDTGDRAEYADDAGTDGGTCADDAAGEE